MVRTSYFAVLSPSSPRAAAWRECFGGLQVRVTNPEPHFATAPGFQNGGRFYLVPLNSLTPGQIDHVCRQMAAQFRRPLRDVFLELEVLGGVPMLAEDVTIVDAEGRPFQGGERCRTGAIDNRLL